MKRAIVFGAMLFLCTSFATEGYPLSYEIDLNGDRSWDTGREWEISVGDTVGVDIWLDGYTCDPEDKLFGAQLYFSYDSGKLQVIDAFANDASRGGPFDPGLSGFKLQKPGVYLLVSSNFNHVIVNGGLVFLGTILLEGTSSGNTTIKVTNSLGGKYNDGFVSDCNLKNLKNPPDGPTDAIARISLTGGGGEEDQGKDEEESSEGGSEYDAGYGNDYPEQRSSSSASEKSASSTPGIVRTGDDRVKTLTNRPRRVIPETSREEYLAEETMPVVQAKSGNLSSGRNVSGSERRGPPARSGKTTPETTTTTTKKNPSAYQVRISPSSVALDSGGSARLGAQTLLKGETVEGSYSWEIVSGSRIGSSIDENGLFVAGSNVTGKSVKETVRATDTKHGIEGETTVTVVEKKTPPAECALLLNPSSLTVYTGDTVAFSARNTGRGCGAGTCGWRVNTTIGSTIDAEGLYRAGQNTGTEEKFDIVIAEDAANKIRGEVLVTVLPGTQVPASRSASGKQSKEPLPPGPAKGFPNGVLFGIGAVLVVAACVAIFRMRR